MSFEDIAYGIRKREFRDALPMARDYVHRARAIESGIQKLGEAVPTSIKHSWDRYYKALVEDRTYIGFKFTALDAAIAIANPPVMVIDQGKPKRTEEHLTKVLEALDRQLSAVESGREMLFKIAKHEYKSATGPDAARIQELCRDIQTL